MAHASEIPQTLSRLFHSLRACDHHRDVQGWSDLVEGLHDTLRMALGDVENFLQCCSGSLPRDHDSAIGTPEDSMLVVATDDASDATLTVSSHSVAATCQPLPPLNPNVVFDHPDAESTLLSMNLSPTSQYFDFSRFYGDAATPAETSSPAASHRHTDLDLNGTGPLGLYQEEPRDLTADDATGPVESPPSRCAELIMTETSDGHVGESATGGGRDGPVPLHPHANNAVTRERPPAVAEWTSLDRIVGKVASPDEIYQALMKRAGKYASQTSRLQYLTRLFFHFAGPHAFDQIRRTFSALLCTTEFDLITLGGRVRALDRLVQAGPVEKRALTVSLCNERTRLQACARNECEGQPERAALNEMVASAYPGLKPSSQEYATKKTQLQGTLDQGQHWLTAHQRSPSALFCVPSNVSETTFRLMPRDLASAFFDLLYFYRGPFLRRVDELLGPIVIAFIDGQRPSQPIPFGHVTLGQMRKYPMDSEFFIDLSRIVASSMSPRACPLEQNV